MKNYWLSDCQDEIISLFSDIVVIDEDGTAKPILVNAKNFNMFTPPTITIEEYCNSLYCVFVWSYSLEHMHQIFEQIVSKFTPNRIIKNWEIILDSIMSGSVDKLNNKVFVLRTRRLDEELLA